MELGAEARIAPCYPARRRRAVRRIVMSSSLAIVLAAGLSGLPLSQGGDGPLLEPGPFRVGFATSWGLDHGRVYATAFDGGVTYGGSGAPRPILVNLWYPADSAAGGEPMPYGAYFAIAPARPDDRGLAAFARALVGYARGVLVQEVFGKEEATLTEDERIELGVLLEAPTSAFLDAPPAPGPFPLVVHHSGAGSSYEDDAYFCEYLASHGYVVAGSAYPDAAGESLGIDGEEGSTADARFLIRRAASLSFVDRGRVALTGHSAGAQASLRHAATAGCAADALVLLDTTQDYYGLAMPTFRSLVDEVLAGKEHVGQAVLAVAGPEAMFELCDALVEADRTYLTVPRLGHNEFISQGIQRLERIARRAEDDPGAADSKELARAPGAVESYVELCEYVRAFLDAHLRDDGGRLDELNGEYVATVLGEDAFKVQRVPVGVSGPEPYASDAAAPPTPRQLARLAESAAASEVVAVLEAHEDARPESPIYSSGMLAGSLVYGLVADGREDEARELYAYFRDVPVDLVGFFGFMAQMSEAVGRVDRAIELLRVALLFEPEDDALRARMKALRGN